MTKTNVKYAIARDEADNCEYYLENLHEFATTTKLTTATNTSSFWRKTSQTLFLISLYFILSIGLTFYQQWLYNTYGFHYPLVVVICHLCIKFLLTLLIRYVIRYCKRQAEVKLPWQSIIRSLAPPGIASGFDIGFSNWAISLITISLYTMTKSTAIIFILGFSLIFKLEKKSWSLVGIVVMISSGLIMFTYKSTQFHLFGFILCLLASLSSGLRWTMAQIIMQKSKLGLKSPVDMIFYMQPWMLLALLPIAIWFEAAQLFKDLSNADWSNSRLVMSAISVVIGGAILAFSMEIMEFMVVTYTSSLTLSISGIFKEICILILAFEWKGDKMSGINFVGLLMCLGGIILHIIKKIVANKMETTEELELQSSNSLTSTCSKSNDVTESNLPLLTQKSTSLTNLLNTHFSSDEDDDMSENSSQILFSIVQRRE